MRPRTSALRDPHLPKKDLDALNAAAPENIACWVVTLNKWRLANDQPMQGIDPRAGKPNKQKA